MNIVPNGNGDAELRFRLFVSESRPAPKFRLWQRVAYQTICDDELASTYGSVLRDEGVIVGKVWNHPDWEIRMPLGWTYFITWLWSNAPYFSVGFTDFVHEVDLIPIEAFTDSEMTTSIERSLKSSTYLNVLDFIKQKTDEGKLIEIASQLTNQCLHINNLLTPERGIWKPAKFVGYNYSQAWDTTRTGQLNDDYHQLRNLLSRDGYIPDFEFRNRRVDGSIGRYQKTYYLIEDFLGEPARLSVADPDAWELVRTGS